MSWTTRPADLDAPGHLVRGDELEETLDQIASLTGSGWTDISSTFVIGSSTTAPTKGNSTYVVRYRCPSGSDVVDFEMYILIGSTFSAGSGGGLYRFPVPFNASANSILCSTGAGYVFENTVANRAGMLRFEAAGYLNFYYDGGSSAVTNTGLSTSWTTGDIIAGSIRYEPA